MWFVDIYRTPGRNVVWYDYAEIILLFTVIPLIFSVTGTILMRNAYLNSTD